jgi:SNF2 family DNA or RNA helicase
MNLAKLKEELKKRGIQTNSKQRKADLQKVLKEAVKQKIKVVEAEEEELVTKGKRKKPDSPSATAKKPKLGKKTDSADKKITTQDKINEQNIQKWWVEKHGTKLGNFLFYLRRLWTDDPSAKILIFSRFTNFLNTIADLLDSHNINYSYAEGTARNRVREITAFKKISTVRVALLDITSLASGTNIIEASHIMLMEPYLSPMQNATTIEAQAIARAHRQGQTRNVTVVRFVVRNSIEYNTHVRNNGKPDAAQGQPKLQRTNSLTTALITTPSLQNSAQLVNLLEETNAIQNNFQ